MPEKVVYDLDAIRQRELGKDSPFPVLMVGGEEFTILPYALWGDAAFTVQTTGDIVSAARAMLGDEQYDRYIAAGGTAGLVMLALTDAQGASLPESEASTDS